MENLKKLSFTSSGKQSKKPSKNRKNKRPFAQGNKKHDTDFHFSNSGRLVAGRQLVYLIDDELGKDQVYRFCTKKILDDLFNFFFYPLIHFKIYMVFLISDWMVFGRKRLVSE